MAGAHPPMGDAQLTAATGGSSDMLRAEIARPSISSSISNQNSQVLAVSAKLSWTISEMYPNGKREEDASNVSFFLRQIGLEHSSESLLADFQIYVVDATGSNTMSICRDAKEFTNQQGRGKFQVARERLIHYVHGDGKLHLCCDVEYLPNACTTARQEHKIWEQSPDRAVALRDRLADLYNDSVHTDFEITVNGQIFQTHRAILAHASDVFDSMFKNGMRESTEGQARITETTISAVRAMLEYFYTNSIERQLFEKNTRDILIIADRYNVARLKEECERHIAESMSIKNFCSLVTFADMYTCDVLMTKCRDFLLANYDFISSTRDWTDLKHRQPAIINDLLERSLQDRIGASSSRAATINVQSSLNDSGEPLAKRTRRTRVSN